MIYRTMAVSYTHLVGELVTLNREDINFNERECVVFGKGNKERLVYFDARTKIHLQNYPVSYTHLVGHGTFCVWERHTSMMTEISKERNLLWHTTLKQSLVCYTSIEVCRSCLLYTSTVLLFLPSHVLSAYHYPMCPSVPIELY